MKKVLCIALSVLLAAALAACSSAAPSSSASSAPAASSSVAVSSAPASSSVPAPSSTSLAAPVNTDAPLPEAAKALTLQPGELLFSTELQHEEVEQFLISFVLAEDKQTVHDVMVQVVGLAGVEDPEGARTPVIFEDITNELGSFDVVDGAVSIETEDTVMELTIDGEAAAGTVAFHYTIPGFSFDGFEGMMIEGMEYPDDVPPHEADLGVMDAEFHVAARG